MKLSEVIDMGVLHDYVCPKHGLFESMEEKCYRPRCKQQVLKVFLQPPGLLGDNTKKADKNINQLAIDFNMTNIKSTREGESQAGYYTRNNQSTAAAVESASIPREPRPGDAAIWGGQGKGMSMASVLSGKYNKPVGPSIGQAPEAAGMNPKDAGNLTGPRAASYIRDHQNLKIDQ